MRNSTSSSTSFECRSLCVLPDDGSCMVNLEAKIVGVDQFEAMEGSDVEALLKPFSNCRVSIRTDADDDDKAADEAADDDDDDVDDEDGCMLAKTLSISSWTRFSISCSSVISKSPTVAP